MSFCNIIHFTFGPLMLLPSTDTALETAQCITTTTLGGYRYQELQ